MTAEEQLVLYYLDQAHLCESPIYAARNQQSKAFRLTRINRHGLGYQERLVLRIIRWVAEAYTPEQIQAEINQCAEAERLEFARQAAASANANPAKTSAGKIDRAANTAALLAALAEKSTTPTV
jgi:hypothetical protein